MIKQLMLSIYNEDGTVETQTSALWCESKASPKGGESILGIWVENNQGIRTYYHPMQYKKIVCRVIEMPDNVLFNPEMGAC